MDFHNQSTQEMDLFRKDVHAWLKENFPKEMQIPVDATEFSMEQYRYWLGKRRELAAKGWLYPMYPKEYGGGGLSAEHETIIEEEMHRAGLRGDGENDPHIMNSLVIPTLLVWGTEEQRQKFLIPFLKGEKTAWQKFTEPHSGADLASYQSTAVRDGDGWVLNGSNVFITGYGTPDYLFGFMVTDPDAPRHRNLGFFLIPVPSPGLEIRRQKLVHGSDQHFIFLDNVRVPADHLIGGDHQGWQVGNTPLELEHGGRGQAFPDDEMVTNLLGYMRERRQRVEWPGGDSVLQQIALDAYLDAHVSGLFSKRAYWMYMNRMETNWEGPSARHFHRLYGIRNIGRSREVMGMYGLLGTREPRAPFGGAVEVFQRWSFVHQHGAGSFNISKVILARRIGISRTQERAAPTRATATVHGS